MSFSKTYKTKGERTGARRKQFEKDRRTGVMRKYRTTMHANGCNPNARQVQTAEERDAIADYLARNPVKRY